MKSRLLTWLGVTLIVQTGLLHLYATPVQYLEAPYLGILFSLVFVAALVAASGIFHQMRWGWGFGTLITRGALVGYVFSRTTGMPGMKVELWGDVTGSMALAVEAGFLIVALFAAPWKRPTVETETVAGKSAQPAVWVRGLFSTGALLVIGLITVFTVQADERALQATRNQYGTPQARAVSTAGPEAEDDLHVTPIGATAVNRVIDHKLRILDAENAGVPLKDPKRLAAHQTGTGSHRLLYVPLIAK